uniref:Baculoviral IAP repeat-containing protein 2 n=1 Tax=Strongyloides stercoralis TaxID=6248 RepID=A0A0K0EI85_STRER
MTMKSFADLANLTSFTNHEVTDLLLTINRLKTFKSWPFDNVKNAKCTSYELAKSGFYMTSNEENAPSAKCMCCLKDLTWEEEDIPLNEHLRIMPHCRLAKIISEKKEIDMTVKDTIGILSMREVALAVNNQLDQDISMIRSALNYNDELVTKTLRNFS